MTDGGSLVVNRLSFDVSFQSGRSESPLLDNGTSCVTIGSWSKYANTLTGAEPVHLPLGLTV